MANDPLDFVRIEETIAAHILSSFEALLGNTVSDIEHKCTDGDFSGAYAIINGLDLTGLIESKRVEFEKQAISAALFGASEVVPLNETDMVRTLNVPREVFNAVDQLVVMMENHVAEMIRDDLRMIVRNFELNAKDELFAVSKADLDTLYMRWNEARNENAGMLRAYLDRREQAALAGNPFIMAVNLYAAVNGGTSLSVLQDAAFAYGNLPWQDRFGHGPATLQVPESIQPTTTMDLGIDSLQRKAFLYSHGGIGVPPQNAGEVIVGTQFSPTSLQLDGYADVKSDPLALQSLRKDAPPYQEDDAATPKGIASEDDAFDDTTGWSRAVANPPVIPLPKRKTQKFDPDEARDADGKWTTAYHGSPYSFDKFQLDSIGSGEGNQSYGYGLYFAENKDVANSYNTGATPEIQNSDGTEVDVYKPGGFGYNMVPYAAQSALLQSKGNYIEAHKILASMEDYQLGSAPDSRAQSDSMLTSWEKRGVKYVVHGGVYTVKIKTPQSELLDWDAPLSKQGALGAKIAGYLKDNDIHDSTWTADLKANKDTEVTHTTGEDVTGGVAMEQLQNHFGYIRNDPDDDPDDRIDNTESQEKAANLVRSFGSRGVKYLDQFSRQARAGIKTHNYVIFDPDDVEITHKNGIPVTKSDGDHNAFKRKWFSLAVRSLPTGDLGKKQALGVKKYDADITKEEARDARGRWTLGFPVKSTKSKSTITIKGKDVPVKGSPDDPDQVGEASFSHMKVIGPRTMKVADLKGGVSLNDPEQRKRVDDLKAKITSDEGHISRLLADTEGNVLEGQHRLEALRELGAKEAPVHVIQDLAAGLNEGDLAKVARDAQPLHSDHVNQIITRVLDAVSDSGSPSKAREEWEAPRGFEKAWNALLDHVNRQGVRKDDLTEGDLAATGGLLNPSQGGARKRKKFIRAVKAALASDTLYVHRPLLNTSAQALIEWAKENGFTSTLDPSDMHVTICYSKSPVAAVAPDVDHLTVHGGGREIEQFGKATVLHFTSPELADRNFLLSLLGASSDFDQYRSHVTISYDGAPDNATSLVPFDGPLEFGSEVHAPINEDWRDSKIEAAIKADAAQTALAMQMNAATLGTGKQLFDIGANLTTSRVIAFGFLDQASKAGHTTYQVNEILDEKTCPVCVFMNGKTFVVPHEYGKILQALGTSDPKQLKSIAPWPSQSKAGLMTLYSLTPAEMQSAGYGSPPYHPHCRGYLSVAGSVKETIPTGTLAAKVQEIIDGLQPEEDNGVVPLGDYAQEESLDGADEPDSVDDFTPEQAIAFDTVNEAVKPNEEEPKEPIEPSEESTVDLPQDQAFVNDSGLSPEKQAFYASAGEPDSEEAGKLAEAIDSLEASDFANAAFYQATGEWELLDTLLMNHGIDVLNPSGSDDLAKADVSNEPRDSSGKWTNGGGSLSGEGELVEQGPTHGTLLPALVARKAIVEVANDLGYNPDKIEMTRDDRKFMLNGKEYFYAGSANIYQEATDPLPIKMYLNQLTSENIKGVAAHEIEHMKFQHVLNLYDAQRTAVIEEEKNIARNGGNPMESLYQKGSFQLQEPYASKFPVYNTMKKVYHEVDQDVFARSDGVSDYSKQYWDGWHKGEINTQIAMHETLAEMSRIKYETGSLPKEYLGSGPAMNKTFTKSYMSKGKKAWKGLFDLVEKYGNA